MFKEDDGYPQLGHSFGQLGVRHTVDGENIYGNDKNDIDVVSGYVLPGVQGMSTFTTRKQFHVSKNKDFMESLAKMIYFGIDPSVLLRRKLNCIKTSEGHYVVPPSIKMLYDEYRKELEDTRYEWSN
ncbi:hypothetical protein CH368_17940 [Leptospira levettii]|nr:hypothetical protein CH368_17940 [Leptospira levettii]